MEFTSTDAPSFAKRLQPWCGGKPVDGILGIKYSLGLCNMEQFAEVGHVLELLESEADSPEALYEKRVIEAMLSDNDEDIYKRSVFSLLALRHAFTSEWARNNVDPAETKDVIRKILLAFGGAYQREIKDLPAEIAVHRFAYETTLQFLDDAEACPTYDFTISPEMYGASPQDGPTYAALPFKNYNLSEFVRNNPDDVEAIIALALKHRTTDHNVLSRLLISPETPLALNQGVI